MASLAETERGYDEPHILPLSRTDVVYTGQISREGNTLINVSVDGKPPVEIRLAWGTALYPCLGATRNGIITVTPPEDSVESKRSTANAELNPVFHSASPQRPLTVRSPMQLCSASSQRARKLRRARVFEATLQLTSDNTR
jgi:hypothetical protein